MFFNSHRPALYVDVACLQFQGTYFDREEVQQKEPMYGSYLLKRMFPHPLQQDTKIVLGVEDAWRLLFQTYDVYFIRYNGSVNYEPTYLKPYSACSYELTTMHGGSTIVEHIEKYVDPDSGFVVASQVVSPTLSEYIVEQRKFRPTLGIVLPVSNRVLNSDAFEALFNFAQHVNSKTESLAAFES